MTQTLVMVVHRDGQGDLGLILPDDIVVEHFLDVCRARQLVRPETEVGRTRLFGCGGAVLGVVALVDDAHTQADTFVADIRAVAGDEPVDHRLGLAAKAAAYIFALFKF